MREKNYFGRNNLTELSGSLTPWTRGNKYSDTMTLRNTVKFRKFKDPFRGAYFCRGLSTEGNLHFQIDWASLIVGGKFTIFALFYFVFGGNVPSTSPRGDYIWRGDLT